jgi:hypothetical protein
MVTKSEFWKEVEGDGLYLLKGLPRYLPGEREEDKKIKEKRISQRKFEPDISQI